MLRCSTPPASMAVMSAPHETLPNCWLFAVCCSRDAHELTIQAQRCDILEATGKWLLRDALSALLRRNRLIRRLRSRVPQPEVLHLAQDVARQAPDEHHVARDLEAGELARDVRL